MLALAEPDWSAPWFAPWRDAAPAAWASWSAGAPLHQALNHALQAPLQFVAAGDLPRECNYEQFIAQHAACPVREGWHDFFNALVWARFPHSKKALNQLHVDEIARLGASPVRGAARDGATLFDESAALLQGPPLLWQALQARDWQTLFVRERALWASARVIVFGHALLEHLVAPRKNLVAHTWYAGEAINSIADLDAELSPLLTPQKLAQKPFAPLPLLGLPGWCAANQEPGFYQDRAVFREPRRG